MNSKQKIRVPLRAVEDAFKHSEWFRRCVSNKWRTVYKRRG